MPLQPIEPPRPETDEDFHRSAVNYFTCGALIVLALAVIAVWAWEAS